MTIRQFQQHVVPLIIDGKWYFNINVRPYYASLYKPT